MFILYYRLRGILGRSNSPSCLIKALACVRVPECFFLYYMEKFSKILKKDASIWLRELNLLKNEIYFNNIQFKGNVFLENKLWKRLDELFGMIFETAKHIFVFEVRQFIYLYFMKMRK